jgi:hypothetical protein
VDADVAVDLTPCKQPFAIPLALPMLGLKGRY